MAGMFKPSGTDTVPAMLTPNEFVVNAASARANMGLLRHINRSRGPVHLAGGGTADFQDQLGPNGVPYQGDTADFDSPLNQNGVPMSMA